MKATLVDEQVTYSLQLVVLFANPQQPAHVLQQHTVSSNEALQALFKSLQADHTLAVQQQWTDTTTHIPLHNQQAMLQQQMLAASMLAVYTAHRQADHKSKLSLVTFGIRGPAAAEHAVPPYAAAAIGCSRTLFMEARAAYGVSIDIWPPADICELQVREHAELY